MRKKYLWASVVFVVASAVMLATAAEANSPVQPSGQADPQPLQQVGADSPAPIKIDVTVVQVDFGNEAEVLRAVLFGRSSVPADNRGCVALLASDRCSEVLSALQKHPWFHMLTAEPVVTSDNQKARALFPYVRRSETCMGLPMVTGTVTFKGIDVIVEIIPKINSDGSVTLGVTPEVYKSTIQVSTGVTADAFDIKSMDVTTTAKDGETAIIGGLVSIREEYDESKTPFLGDLPWVGAAFCHSTVHQRKYEMLFFVTPHVVRTTPTAVLGRPQ